MASDLSSNSSPNGILNTINNEEKEEGEISLEDVSSSEETQNTPPRGYKYQKFPRARCQFCLSNQHHTEWCRSISRIPNTRDAVQGKENRRLSKDATNTGTKISISTLQEKNDDLVPISSDSDMELVGLEEKIRKKKMKTSKSNKTRKKKKKLIDSTFTEDKIKSSFLPLASSVKIRNSVIDKEDSLKFQNSSEQNLKLKTSHNSSRNKPNSKSPPKHHKSLKSSFKRLKTPTFHYQSSLESRKIKKLRSPRKSPIRNLIKTNPRKINKKSHSPVNSSEINKHEDVNKLLKKVRRLEPFSSRSKDQGSSLKDKLSNIIKCNKEDCFTINCNIDVHKNTCCIDNDNHGSAKTNDLLISNETNTEKNFNEVDKVVTEKNKDTIEQSNSVAVEDEDIIILRQKALETKSRKLPLSENIKTEPEQATANVSFDEDIEDLELRMIALRSAVMKKHQTRMKNGLKKKRKKLLPSIESPFTSSFIEDFPLLAEICSPSSPLFLKDDNSIEDMELDSDLELEKDANQNTNTSPYSITDDLNTMFDHDPLTSNEDQLISNNKNTNLRSENVEPVLNLNLKASNTLDSVTKSVLFHENPINSPITSNNMLKSKIPITNNISQEERPYSPTDVTIYDPDLPGVLSQEKNVFPDDSFFEQINESNIEIENKKKFNSKVSPLPMPPFPSFVGVEPVFKLLMEDLNTDLDGSPLVPIEQNVNYENTNLAESETFSENHQYIQKTNFNHLSNFVNETPIEKHFKTLPPTDYGSISFDIINCYNNMNFLGEPLFKLNNPSQNFRFDINPPFEQNALIELPLTEKTNFKNKKKQSRKRKKHKTLNGLKFQNNFLVKTQKISEKDSNTSKEKTGLERESKLNDSVNCQNEDQIVENKTKEKNNLNEKENIENKSGSKNNIIIEVQNEKIDINNDQNDKIINKRRLSLEEDEFTLRKILLDSLAKRAKISVEDKSRNINTVEKSVNKNNDDSRSTETDQTTDEKNNKEEKEALNLNKIVPNSENKSLNSSATSTNEKSVSNTTIPISSEVKNPQKSSIIKNDNDLLKKGIKNSFVKLTKLSLNKTTVPVSETISKKITGPSSKTINNTKNFQTIQKKINASKTSLINTNKSNRQLHVKINNNSKLDTSSVNATLRSSPNIIKSIPENQRFIINLNEDSESDSEPDNQTKSVNIEQLTIPTTDFEKSVDQFLKEVRKKQEAASTVTSNDVSTTKSSMINTPASLTVTESPISTLSSSITTASLPATATASSVVNAAPTTVSTLTVTKPSNLKVTSVNLLKTSTYVNKDKISALLNSTSKTKISALPNTPQAVKHLSVQQQAEYRRLKQVIIDRERLKHQKDTEKLNSIQLQKNLENKISDQIEITAEKLNLNQNQKGIEKNKSAEHQTDPEKLNSNQHQKDAESLNLSKKKDVEKDNFNKPQKGLEEVKDNLDTLRLPAKESSTDSICNSNNVEAENTENIPAALSEISDKIQVNKLAADKQMINNEIINNCTETKTYLKPNTSESSCIENKNQSSCFENKNQSDKINLSTNSDEDSHLLRNNSSNNTATNCANNKINKEKSLLNKNQTPPVMPVLRILTREEINLKTSHIQTTAGSKKVLMDDLNKSYENISSTRTKNLTSKKNLNIGNLTKKSNQSLPQSEINTINKDVDCEIILEKSNSSTCLINQSSHSATSSCEKNSTNNSKEASINSSAEITCNEQSNFDDFKKVVQTEINQLTKLPKDEQNIILKKSEEELITKRLKVLDDLIEISGDLRQWEIERELKNKLSLEVKKLKEQLEIAEQKLLNQKEVLNEIQPKISLNQKNIYSGRKECFRLSKICSTIGSEIIGETYKVPAAGAEIYNNRLKEVLIHTRKLQSKKLQANEKVKKKIDESSSNNSTNLSITKIVNSEPKNTNLSVTSHSTNSSSKIKETNDLKNKNSQLQDELLPNKNNTNPVEKSKIINLCINEKITEPIQNISKNLKKIETVIQSINIGVSSEQKTNVELPQKITEPKNKIELSKKPNEIEIQPVNTKITENQIEILQEKKNKEDTKTKFAKPYESILKHLNVTRNNKADGILCPYELMGTCNDVDCQFIHQTI